MNDDFSAAVGRVVQGILEIEEDIRRGATPTVAEVRSGAVRLVSAITEQGRRSPTREEDYELARCALVCWIDEVFTIHCPWPHKHDFRAQCLELLYPELHELKGRRIPATRRPVEGPILFYEMADVARTRPEVDALEAFVLCVALGFEGELYREDERRNWLDAAYAQLKERQGPDPAPIELPVGEGLRPLFGGHLRLGVAWLVAGTALATLIGLIVAIHFRPY